MYYVLLTIFGTLGAVTRYALSILIDMAQFPLATLTVNLLGCFFLASITYFLLQMPALPKIFVSAIGTGFIGSFTTFSTFNVESIELLRIKNYKTFFCYIGASYILGIVAAFVGIVMGDLIKSGF
ncbi:putative fluoride ion transporter CrcB 1 [Tetragenococcus halophilus subsp. flandriensis]|uniref:fluoride efflux transporter FluC n=1 Tax=Tetragenococcus halophilus TaxID=51669 RepID=UPI0023E9F151|nr:CrcB family protein [Tetragenococcus halophilus]GMA07143.1 putative fluoride ion transporter CrcB 1 [Tetragenococcus halophilus subsp. flandriensis]